MLKVLAALCLFLPVMCKSQLILDADDKHITYWGRIDFSNPKAPSFEYPGVTVRLTFSGTSVSVKLRDFANHSPSTTNYYYKIVDGGTPEKFEALAGEHTYTLANNLRDGQHTVELVKLTEAFVGRTAFEGFILNEGAQILQNAEPACAIEFIGNSITCGYGNEANIPAPPDGNPSTGFTSVNENNYKAWGYVAARSLGMKYTTVSYSGRGLYRNNTGATEGTLPLIYNRIYPDDNNSPLWNSASEKLNYIVIDLGTNDFAPDPGQPLNQVSFESTYVNFVKKLKGDHPDATIILAVGVMLSDGYPSGAQQWTRIRTYVKNAVATLSKAGIKQVYYFEMDPQTGPYGEDWHPSTATHTRMAQSLVSFIKSLGNPCPAVTGISGKAKTDFRVKVIPAGNELIIDYPGENTEWSIVSTSGVTVLEGNGKKANISHLRSGIYLVKIKDQSIKFHKQ